MSFKMPTKLFVSTSFDVSWLLPVDGGCSAGAVGVGEGDVDVAVALGVVSSIGEGLDEGVGISETAPVAGPSRFTFAAGTKPDRRPRAHSKTERPAITTTTMSSTRKRARPVS